MFTIKCDKCGKEVKKADNIEYNGKEVIQIIATYCETVVYICECGNKHEGM